MLKLLNLLPMSHQNPWKTLSSRLIYENPWIRVREDKVIRPNGEEGIYSVVTPRIAAGVIAMTPKKEIYLVGQYRYPTDMYSWEIIEGGADPGEAPLEAAKRELQEEAGLIANKWEPLGGEIHLSNCFSSETGFLFLAEELEETEKAPDETEILEIKKLPFQEAYEMVLDGTIKDTMSIVALHTLAHQLSHQERQ